MKGQIKQWQKKVIKTKEVMKIKYYNIRMNIFLWTLITINADYNQYCLSRFHLIAYVHFLNTLAIYQSKLLLIAYPC